MKKYLIEFQAMEEEPRSEVVQGGNEKEAISRLRSKVISEMMEDDELDEEEFEKWGGINILEIKEV